MKNLNNTLTSAIAVIALAFMTLLSGCEYEYVEPEIVPIPTQVSFATDIIPIFDASCNMSGCHAAGAIAPDLSSAGAYASLFQANLINTTVPAESDLYKIITTGSMKSFTSTSQAQTILVWIQKGALNN